MNEVSKGNIRRLNGIPLAAQNIMLCPISNDPNTANVVNFEKDSDEIVPIE